MVSKFTTTDEAPILLDFNASKPPSTSSSSLPSSPPDIPPSQKYHSSTTPTSSSSGNPNFSSHQASIFAGEPAINKNVILGADDVNESLLFSQEIHKYGLLDDELVYLSQIITPDTAANREWCFKHSDTAQVIHRLVTMSIVGNGVKVQSDNLIIEQELNQKFQNLRGPYQSYSIIDLTSDILRDNMIHAQHLSSFVETPNISIIDAYKISIPSEDFFSGKNLDHEKTGESKTSKNSTTDTKTNTKTNNKIIDKTNSSSNQTRKISNPAQDITPTHSSTNQSPTSLRSQSPTSPTSTALPKNPVGRPPKKSRKVSIQTHRIDMRTIQKITHPTNGSIKFIQDVYTWQDIPSITEFYSKEYNPTIRTVGGIGMQPDMQTRKIINIKPENVLYVDLFREPPIASIMDLISHRMWLMWAQKKVGLKYAAPIPIIKLTQDGDADDQNPKDREETMNRLASQFSSARFGDAIVLDVDQEWVDQKSVGSNPGFDFDDVINSYDKRIALALGSSMALFDASGAELATSRTIQDTFLRYIAGIREKLSRAFKILCYKHLSSMNIPFKEEEFKFIWSPLRDRMLGEVINAVVNFWNSGLIQNMQEARSMAEGVFDLENLDKTEDMSYLDTIEQKEYVAARGRAKAEIEKEKEVSKIRMKEAAHTASLQPTSPTSPNSNPSAKINKARDNQQGSQTGNIQSGQRKAGGPQPDSGMQSASERDSQLQTSSE